MKKLNWFDRFLFLLNSLFAAALLFTYLLPYIPPTRFALLSVLSLTVPMLIIINLAFLIYWVLRFKRQFLMPFIVLLLGFNHLTSIYEFNSDEDTSDKDGSDFSIMSYNVRHFNENQIYGNEGKIAAEVAKFVKKQDPEVMNFQEYYKEEGKVAELFPHSFIKMKTKNAEFGLAIFSKYPMIHRVSLDFTTKSNNNAIYADLVKGKDTVRVINVHFQSFSTKPDMENIESEHSKKVFLGMGQTFAVQQEQMEMVLDVIMDSPYRVILTGDFNNTAYSYIYRKLRSAGYGLNDAYKEAGSGFGRTFNFKYFPLRIDFILVGDRMKVTSFKTMRVLHSDHFPIKAGLEL